MMLQPASASAVTPLADRSASRRSRRKLGARRDLVDQLGHRAALVGVAGAGAVEQHVHRTGGAVAGERQIAGDRIGRSRDRPRPRRDRRRSCRTGCRCECRRRPRSLGWIARPWRRRVGVFGAHQRVGRGDVFAAAAVGGHRHQAVRAGALHVQCRDDGTEAAAVAHGQRAAGGEGVVGGGVGQVDDIADQEVADLAGIVCGRAKGAAGRRRR